MSRYSATLPHTINSPLWHERSKTLRMSEQNNFKMGDLTSTMATIAAVVLFILSFLYLPVVQYSGYAISITGSQVIETCTHGDNGPAWPFLFIIVPVFVAAIRWAISVKSEATRNAAIANSFLMVIPFFMLFKEGHENLGGAIIICFLLAIGIVVIAFMTDPDAGKDNGSEVQTNHGKSHEPQQITVRKQYDEAKLREVVSNSALYKASLVEACKKELQIRESASGFMDEVRNYPDDKIGQILASRDTYSDAIVFCCQKVRAERLAEQRKVEARKREEEKQRLIQEEKEKQEKRNAWWKKNWIYVSLVVVLLLSLILLLLIMPFLSDPEFISYVNLNEYWEMIKYVLRSLLGNV